MSDYLSNRSGKEIDLSILPGSYREVDLSNTVIASTGTNLDIELLGSQNITFSVRDKEILRLEPNEDGTEYKIVFNKEACSNVEDFAKEFIKIVEQNIIHLKG